MKRTKNEAAAGGSRENREPGKQYITRLADAGLTDEDGNPLAPMTTGRSSPGQSEIALIAAALAKNSDTCPTALAARALDIWKASGTAVLVEHQAAVLTKGVLHFDVTDWEAHAKSLVGMLNAGGGGVPGQKSAEEARKAHEKAQADAAKAVYQLWRHGPENETVLAALFTGKAETKETREEKFVALLAHAKKMLGNSDRLMWESKSPDKLSERIRGAWKPLGLWGEKVLPNTVKEAKSLIDSPKVALQTHRLALNPLVARWLAVVRADQLMESKNRAAV